MTKEPARGGGPAGVWLCEEWRAAHGAAEPWRKAGGPNATYVELFILASLGAGRPAKQKLHPSSAFPGEEAASTSCVASGGEGARRIKIGHPIKIQRKSRGF